MDCASDRSFQQSAKKIGKGLTKVVNKCILNIVISVFSACKQKELT